MEYNMGSHDSRQNGRSLREQAPRQLNPFTRATILFGGVTQQMGWGFFGFGMIFFWAFVMNSEARYLLSFDGNWVETQGMLKNIESTNSSVNKRTIYAYQFSYTANGRQMESVCYDVSRSELQPNRAVRVEYKSGNPQRARIEGMSTSAFPAVVLFVVIFPIVGLVFLFFGLRSNIKALKLLINGTFSKGKMIAKEATGTQINNNMVFKYIFEFEAKGGMKYQAKCATHHTWRVEDEEMEIILYDPSYPENAVVFDAIPTAPQINSLGHFEPATLGAAKLLILPLIAIVLNLFLFYFFVLS